MDNRKTISRTNSICPSPEEILLDIVKTNQVEKLREFIADNGQLLSFEYSYPHYGKIIYIACTDPSITTETFATLLDLGADPCDETPCVGEAIHVLSRSTLSGKLKILLNYLNHDQVNHIFKGNNALLVLIKEGDYSKLSELLECAKILIKSGIDVNHTDNKNLQPIFWAIKKDCKELIEILINNSSDLDIDTFTMNGKSARELLMSQYSYDLVLNKTVTNKATDRDFLFNYLRSYNEDAFVSFNKGDISALKDIDDGTYTLLQLSCHLGLVKAVRHLLENKADLRKTTNQQVQTPLELAGEKGYHEIVELLLNDDHALKVPSSTISILLNKMNLSDSSEKYEICFQHLMKNQDDVSLNAPNELSQTPLHFAVRFSKSKHVLDLLKKGSSLAMKNQFDIMPIEFIDAEILEEHLDECVEINDIDKNNIYATLNYRTLIPFPLEVTRKSCEDGGRLQQNPNPETDAILYMCQAPHLRHLLTHPIIVTFLLLKWYKVYNLFLVNILFYILFLLSLVCYIFTSYGNFYYILDDSWLKTISSISYSILCVTFVLLFLRELFQILVSPRSYFKELDNWIEDILIILVGAILFIRDPTNDTKKQLCSLAILFSAFELLLMMGQHPALTTYVVMFKRVSYNFLKFLAWYFLLIAAFALSFYILFSENHDAIKTSTDDPEEVEENFFDNPGGSLFKTLVMLTGEFDASDMNFHSFPITSKLIFILFVLMIALILLNLLNGLAVSDTQTIKNDAECVGLVARTHHIHYIESMVLGNILPTTLFSFLQKLCCCLPLFDDLRMVLSTPLSQYVSLYPKTYLTIPFSNDIEISKMDKKSGKKEKALSAINSFYLGREIRRKIKKVLQKQKLQKTEDLLKNKIRKLESQQVSIISILEDIQRKLKSIENKS